jgi:hypothetical protein
MPRLGARIRACPCDVSGGEEIVAVTRGAGDSIHGLPGLIVVLGEHGLRIH